MNRETIELEKGKMVFVAVKGTLLVVQVDATDTTLEVTIREEKRTLGLTAVPYVAADEEERVMKSKKTMIKTFYEEMNFSFEREEDDHDWVRDAILTARETQEWTMQPLHGDTHGNYAYCRAVDPEGNEHSVWFFGVNGSSANQPFTPGIHVVEVQAGWKPTRKYAVRAWLELPIAGVDPIEDEIELDPHDDPDVVGQGLIENLYQNNVPSGMEIIEVDE